MPDAKNATKPRVEPEITAVAAPGAIPMPERKNNRGSKTNYPFDQLTAKGMSFGVKNKTAKGLASIVSNQNKKNKVQATDENGNKIFEMKELKADDGTVTKVPDTDNPKMVVEKHFFAVDVDPKTDPDKASVRVFRDI